MKTNPATEQTSAPATPAARGDGLKRWPISHLHFVDALDFPGVQESHVACGPEPKPSGRSYVGSYIPELGAFELKLYNNGIEVGVRLVPRERVKQFER